MCLIRADLFYGFRNPSNSDMDYRICNMCLQCFRMHLYAKDLSLMPHQKDFTVVESAQNILTPENSQGGPST